VDAVTDEAFSISESETSVPSRVDLSMLLAQMVWVKAGGCMTAVADVKPP